MAKRLTIEFIRSEFAKEKYELLSTEYKNNNQKLNYVCSKGHRYSITWHNWHRGSRCPYCYGNGKLSIEFIRSEFAKENYILLTTEYINSYTKLDYICPNGHKHSINWGAWEHSGNRCPYCVNCPPIDIEFVRSEFAKEGYKLLTTEYINNKQKLNYICPKGHKFNITWRSWRKGADVFTVLIKLRKL